MTCLSVSCWPPGSTSSGLLVPCIIFNVRNNMLTLTKLYLYIQHEGIPKCNLNICTWLALRISLQVPDIIWHKNWNLDPNKNQKLASKISHIYCIGIKYKIKNSYIPYESGILVCLLVILWSLANEYHIFVVLNELIGIQNPQFKILRTTISKRMAIHYLRFFYFWLKKDHLYSK